MSREPRIRLPILAGAVSSASFSSRRLAKAIQPHTQPVIRVFWLSANSRRKIAGHGFIDPLIAIAGPADDVAPPLVRDFVKGNQIVEVFLTTGGKSGALLRFRGKKRIGGKVEQPRPALAKSSGDLRDAELANRKRPGESFVESNGGIDIVRQLFQRVSRSRLGHGQAEARGRRAAQGPGSRMSLISGDGWRSGPAGLVRVDDSRKRRRSSRRRPETQRHTHQD